MMAAETANRKYPRVKAPKSALVAWKTGELREVSHVRTIALGGLLIPTRNPAKKGSMLQMLIVTPKGHVRVRSTVRSVFAGEGMGVAIMAMEPEDRAKLDRWLKQLAELEGSAKKRE